MKAGLVVYLFGLADLISTKSGTKGMPENLHRPEHTTGTTLSHDFLEGILKES